MKIGLLIDGVTIFSIFESKPSPGDHVQIPIADMPGGNESDEGSVDVRIGSLPTTWKMDEDGCHVPVMEAVFVNAKKSG